MKEDQIQALLKQRAEHFQAPDDYAKDLLQKLHQRQRSEWLRQPLWRIAWERLETFLSEHSFSTPTYAVALSTLTLTGILAIWALRSSSPLSPESFTSSGSATARVDRSSDRSASGFPSHQATTVSLEKDSREEKKPSPQSQPLLPSSP